jgi:hypothetical protein
MSTSISCTNFGDCRIADSGQQLWSELLAACPYCGKALGSPHRVTIESIAGTVRENTSVEVKVKVKLANKCLKPGGLTLEVDGEQSGDTQDIVDEREDYEFEIPGRGTGLYRICAVLETGDKRKTWSNEQLLLVTEPSNLIAPLLWALLLVLLLCLSAGLALFGKPMLGQIPYEWLTVLVDLFSLLSALLIGGLLIDLGLRERASAGRGESLVRPPPLSGHFLSNRALNGAGKMASTGTALIILGVLPFFFVSILFSKQHFLATSMVWAVACAVAAAVFWSTKLKSLGGPFLSKSQRGAAPPMSAAADSAQAASYEAPPDLVDTPGQDQAQPEKDKA